MIGIRSGFGAPPAMAVRRFGEEKVGVNKEAFQAMAGQAAKDAGRSAEQIKEIVEKAGNKFEEMAQEQTPIITNASPKDVSPKTIRKIAGR